MRESPGGATFSSGKSVLFGLMPSIANLSTYLRLGPVSLAHAGLHALRLELGWYEKALPASNWSTTGTAGICPWPHVLPSSWTFQDVATLADSVARLSTREVPWFGSQWRTLHSSWAENPESGYIVPSCHWSRLPQHSGGEAGDLKLIWEPSRFEWAMSLMRAKAAGVTEADNVFHQLLSDWQSKNLPNLGPAWLCGQETALRALALMRASGSFDLGPELWQIVAASAERVERSMSYALAQNNNHAISEAVALFAVGCALPTHPRSTKWRSMGSRHMEHLCLRQFSLDGGYIQHSFCYHRMALRLAVNYMVMARAAGYSISSEFRQRISASWRLLFEHQDPSTGRLPNYGANDGTNPLALHGMPSLDYRPVIAAAAWVSDEIRPYDAGPHDEEAVWLVGEEYLHAPTASIERKSSAFSLSGYYVLRKAASFATMRCHAYKTRPGQSDSLHVDLWIDGENVLRDAGTWRYWHESGDQAFFSSSTAHNTLVVNGLSHMPRISTFLFADWVQDVLQECELSELKGRVSGLSKAFEGQGVIHRRVLREEDEAWTVEDHLICQRNSGLGVIRWRLSPERIWELRSQKCVSEGISIEIDGPAELEFVSSSADEPDNWESLNYNDRTRIPLLRVKFALSGQVQITTRVRMTTGAA